jgi:hypothetical protein
MTKKTTVKSTLITGAFVFVAVLLVVLQEMGTLMINFRTIGNDSCPMSNALERCQKTNNYLNRQHFTIRTDNMIYETGGKPSRSGEKGERKVQVIQTPLLLRQYKRKMSFAA